MTTQHTPEPWPHLDNVPPNDDIPEAKPHITECCGSVLMDQARYERARACVNACAGMAEPAAEIARLREVNAEMLEALQSLSDRFLPSDSFEECWLADIRRIITEAKDTE